MPQNYGPWVISDDEFKRLTRYQRAQDMVTRNQVGYDIKLLRDRIKQSDYLLPSMWPNIPSLVCRAAADLVLPSTPLITCDDADCQARIDALLKRSRLDQLCWRSVFWACAQGDVFFKISDVTRRGMTQPVISLQRATGTVARNLRAEDSPETRQFLFQSSLPNGMRLYSLFAAGVNRYFAFNQGGEACPLPQGYEAEVQTGELEALAIHLGAMRADESDLGFGESDFKDIEDHLFEIAHRFRQIASILDRHAEPILNAPAGVLNEKSEFDPATKKVIEKGEGGETAEYLVWQSQLAEAYTEIDRLMNLVLLQTETSSAQWGLDKDGKVESGRALKFKMLNSLGKARRTGGMLREGLLQALRLALRREDILAGERPDDYENIRCQLSTTFIADETEEADRIAKLRSANAMSVEQAVQDGQGLSGQARTDEVERINAEKPAAPVGADSFAPLT